MWWASACVSLSRLCAVWSPLCITRPPAACQAKQCTSTESTIILHHVSLRHPALLLLHYSVCVQLSLQVSFTCVIQGLTQRTLVPYTVTFSVHNWLSWTFIDLIKYCVEINPHTKWSILNQCLTGLLQLSWGRSIILHCIMSRAFVVKLWCHLGFLFLVEGKKNCDVSWTYLHLILVSMKTAL